MKKKEAPTQQPLLSEELIVDEKGNLRVCQTTQKKDLNLQLFAMYSPSSIFLFCGGVVIFLIDVLVILLAYSFKAQHLSHNPEAQQLFLPFLATLLLGVTCSLSLLLFIVYKINAPALTRGELCVEVPPSAPLQQD
ncbi:MAG: hypothetical protein JJT94_06655 [Bernardetiaceae bacterium]|nr:hypothetical protein [Bernardetiaceae bacterium]